MRVSRELDVPVADVLAEWGADESGYLDMVHPDADGHLRIARSVVAAMRGAGLGP